MRRPSIREKREARNRFATGKGIFAVSLAGLMWYCGALQRLHALDVAPEPIFSVDAGVFAEPAITFSIAAPFGTVRYTLDGSVPTEASAAYTGAITVGTNTIIKARIFAPGFEPGAVVSRTYHFLEASAATFNSSLPILILNTCGRPIPNDVRPGQPRVPGSFVVIDTFRGHSSLQAPAQFTGLAEYEIFGQTSAGFPKLPYTIEIQDEYRNDRAVPLLGMPAEADWKLRNLFNDKSLINEALAFEVYEQMGHYAVRRRFVEVFADTTGGRIAYPQDYVGVMMLLEKIEVGPDRVPISKLTPADAEEPEISGGYIWKKEKDSFGDLTFPAGRHTFKMHEPKPREITPQQLRWITNHLNQFESALYATNWLSATGSNHYSFYIDVDSFVDQHWIVEFTKNIDGYRLGNFMRKDRGGKIQMDLLWDWELSFGNANYLDGGKTNGWYFPFLGSFDHIWLRRLIGGGVNSLSPANPWGGPGDPDFVQKIIDRWGYLRTNAFLPSRILARVDELAGQLGEAAARDFARFPRLGVYIWPNPDGAPLWDVDYVHPTSHAAIVDELKKWIGGRHAWLDSQFVRAPVFSHSGGVVSPGFSVVAEAPAGTTYYTLDGTDPRAPGGGLAAAARVYSGPIFVNDNVQVFARARLGGGMTSWSPPAVATFIVNPAPLRITELMYHPGGGDDFEYVELRNTGMVPLDVTGFRLSGAVEFTFPPFTIGAGQYALVVKNQTAFKSRYGAGFPIAGEFAGDLGDDGERIVLRGRFQEPILDFSYDDDWYLSTDGHGFSLVIINEDAAPGSWGLASSWRQSARRNGSPGLKEPDRSAIARVVINEVLTHAEPPNENAVEVLNLSDQPVDLGGWYLTDDPNQPRKFRCPPETVVSAGGFHVFTANEFNAPDVDSSLVLSRTGGRIYIFSGDPSGELTGYAHGFTFGPQGRGVSFGRYVTSTGEEHLVGQSSVTLGGVNSGPKVGPIVISEMMYHPLAVSLNGGFWDNIEDEYVELFNAGANPVTLNDPAQPANVWKLAGPVDFTFPRGTAIPPSGFLVVVNFDPARDPARLAAFLSTYGLSSATPVVGPWRGELSNGAATLALLKPDAPVDAGPQVGLVPYVLVEQVHYSSTPPWPLAADGAGFSLKRSGSMSYSDDPANWTASNPTPGGPDSPAVPPVITAQPQSQNAVAFERAMLSVGVAGTSPFRFQWRRNGVILNFEHSSVLVISNIQPSDAGVYQVLVINNSGAAVSSNAVLNVLVKVVITGHPQSVSAPAGSNAVFRVTAESAYPVRYQWRLNGTNLSGATNHILTLSNITNVHEGAYTVVCSDDVGSVLSQAAQLTVRLRPMLVAPKPPVHLTAVPGETVTLGVQLLGDLPIYCRWRLFRPSGGQIISNQLLTARTSFISFPVSSSSAGAYTVILSNSSAGYINTAITNAFLTVLPDSDGDRIPDEFEDAHGLDRQDPADGTPAADADGDGSSNRAEYIAGTDPQDADSFLKVVAVPSADALTLRFGAAANRTYSLQYSDALSPGIWRNLADVLAGTTSRVETIIDPTPDAASRFYRLVTPSQP